MVTKTLLVARMDRRCSRSRESIRSSKMTTTMTFWLLVSLMTNVLLTSTNGLFTFAFTKEPFILPSRRQRRQQNQISFASRRLNIMATNKRSILYISTNDNEVWTKATSSSKSNDDNDGNNNNNKNRNNNNNNNNDDDILLQTVQQDQLITLCESCQLDTSGSKSILLQRLRNYAQEQAEIDKQRLLNRKSKIENGNSGHSREKYEIIRNGSSKEEEDDGGDEIDTEGYFYFQLPTLNNSTSTTSSSIINNETTPTGKAEDVEKNTTTTTTTTLEEKESKRSNNDNDNNNDQKQHQDKPFLTSADITAPPLPPNAVPNEEGEHTVRAYSTSDQNDLTGIASSQPGTQFADNALLSGETGISSSAGGGEGGDSATWDVGQQTTNHATPREIDEAKEVVSELVHSMLAMSGAPAFREEFSGGITPYDNNKQQRRQQPQSSSSSPQEFIGFDPAKVPSDILLSSSKALRTNRGRVLQDVIDEYELRAIGYDGMAEDDKENGGGHYREVSKVRAFLEGYRMAEVRRIARETTTLFLDKLVMEGIEGLDLTLSSMIRSADDTSDVGELNDSLIDYLNDAIRQQEKKVEQLVGSVGSSGSSSVQQQNDDVLNGQQQQMDIDIEVDKTAGLWNVTTEDGERIETLDPNDPEVKSILETEYEKSKAQQEDDDLSIQSTAANTPDTAQEQLLLLLCLLRDRIKTEAAFGNDEKGRNLRILAYCLHSPTNADREQIILKEMGTSLSRIESFVELLDSSIEYTESTSTQLKPGTTAGSTGGGSGGMLNLSLLKSIRDLAEEIKDRQSWKASTGGASKLAP